MTEGNAEISAEDEVMRKGRVNFNSTWLCTLDRIPTFVGALDAASIRRDILTVASQTGLPNMGQLVSMYL
jgi:hypothetical protein